MTRYITGTVLAALLLIPAAYAGRGDFLIVENPRSLQLLDKYEQPLGASERALLLPFSPFRIVKERGTLGDQITPASRVGFQGMELLLPMAERGGYFGADRAGRIRTLRQCALLGDTVEIVKQFALTAEGSGRGITAMPGQRCIRVFESGGRQYLLLDSRQKAYGWAGAGQVSYLRRVVAQEATADTTLPDHVRTRISTRVDSANATYRRYFEYLNQTSGKHLGIPQWHCRERGGGMEIEVSGLSAGLIPQSTKALLSEITSMLMTTDHTATLRGGKIVIALRGGAR